MHDDSARAFCVSSVCTHAQIPDLRCHIVQERRNFLYEARYGCPMMSGDPSPPGRSSGRAAKPNHAHGPVINSSPSRI